MNEDIKKTEISEEQLEGVTGGAQDFPRMKFCPKCGNTMMAHAHIRDDVLVLDFYYCSSCQYEE